MVDINAILRKHEAKAQRKAQKRKTAEESSEKFRREQREEQRKKRDAELRKRRNKGGAEIAEQFIEVVAPHFIAMMKRDDAAKKLHNCRIVFRCYKTEGGKYSAELFAGDVHRNYPGGTLYNMATKHGTDDAPGWLVERLMKKLQDETGRCRYSTHAEALEEILMLKQQLAAANSRIKTLEASQPSPADAFEVKAQPDEGDDDAAVSGDSTDNITDDDETESDDAEAVVASTDQ